MRKENSEVPQISFWDFVIKYMHYLEARHSKLTVRDYGQTFKMFRAFVGNINLSEITSDIIQSYINKRIRESSVHQGRKDLINLKAAFNYAVEQGFFLKNPGNQVKRVRIPEKLPAFFSRDEFNLLLRAIDNPDIRDIVVVAANTGMRRGELLSLEWKSVHLDKMYLVLDNQYFVNKSRRVRSIPLNEAVLAILSTRKRVSKSAYVFTYQGSPMAKDFIAHRFKKYVRKAGLREELCFHSLRHTFATWLVQRGVPIYQVSKLLGHSDVKTTQIYASLILDDLKKSVDTLND